MDAARETDLKFEIGHVVFNDIAGYSKLLINQQTEQLETLKAVVRFGDIDAPIAALPHLLEVPAGPTRADLRYNPLWDPLRKDPHFQKFCEGPEK